jgi:ubiquitin C-terminal hydrolase
MFEQNDLQEFLTLFLDNVNGMMDVVSVVHDTSSCHPLHQKMVGHWYDSQQCKCTMLKNIMFGQLLTHITCGNCGKKHHVFELFSTLMLPIVDDNQEQDLASLLASFTTTESLERDDWRCDTCNTRSDGNKRRNLVSRFPQVLLVCIKRFTRMHHKNKQIIHAPDTLDMQPYAICEVPTPYKLKAIACHSGGASSGHYYALCKHFDNAWYQIDDSFAHKVTQPDQCLPNTPGDAYVLFYALDE